MKKIKEIILLLFVIIVSLNFPVLAEETDNLEVALNTVKESTYFRDYENSINSMDILRESETESGIRYTVRFLLDEESEEHTLIFVLNDNFNIIEALEIEFLEDRMIAVDLQKNYVNEVSLPNSSRVMVRECAEYSCAKWSYISYSRDNACSFIVGQNCSLALLLGKPIAYVLCKAGVFVACNFSIGKVCKEYNYRWVLCPM